MTDALGNPIRKDDVLAIATRRGSNSDMYFATVLDIQERMAPSQRWNKETESWDDIMIHRYNLNLKLHSNGRKMATDDYTLYGKCVVVDGPNLKVQPV